jgi:hypothetical protein
MEKEQYRAAKARLLAGLQGGQSWQRASAGLQISQSNAYFGEPTDSTERQALLPLREKNIGPRSAEIEYLDVVVPHLNFSQ